jgi:pyruvate kinase
VRARLNLRWGVMPFRLDFGADPEENVDRTFALLKRRQLVQAGDLVVVVSDIRPPNEDVVRSAQVRTPGGSDGFLWCFSRVSRVLWFACPFTCS